MSTILRAALAAAVILAATSAYARPQDLAKYYDLVIANCNTTAHPVPCSKNGVDQCGKEFKNMVVAPPHRVLGLTGN